MTIDHHLITIWIPFEYHLNTIWLRLSDFAVLDRPTSVPPAIKYGHRNIRRELNLANKKKKIPVSSAPPVPSSETFSFRVGKKILESRIALWVCGWIWISWIWFKQKVMTPEWYTTILLFALYFDIKLPLSNLMDFPLFDTLPYSIKIQFPLKIELESVNCIEKARLETQ